MGKKLKNKKAVSTTPERPTVDSGLSLTPVTNGNVHVRSVRPSDWANQTPILLSNHVVESRLRPVPVAKDTGGKREGQSTDSLTGCYS